MLKTAVIGKTINGATQVTRVMAISGDKIILVDATTGQAPKKVSTKIVDKDLHIFAEGATEPSVIVSDYVLYDQTVQISGLGSSGEYVNYGLTATNTMELGAVSAMPATASTPFMSSSAWWGVGILAIAGGAAAAGGGGGGSGGSSTPVISTTHTASLVDSVVSGVSYTTSSGLSGVTDANGSFSYKAGDIVTFKVGNATIGTFNTANMNADGIVMPQDIVGVPRTDTTNAAVVNIAQFLQSLDSNSNPIDGIVINPTTASSIGTVAVQTATDAEFTTAGVTTLVEGATATTNLNLVINDTTHPTAAITLSDTVLNSGETATVTITFSEAVVGFSNADVTVANGTLSTLSSLDNITWTATFSPTANITSVTNSISITNTYSDVAGNTGTTATSANYTVSTQVAPPPPPSLIITDDENAVGNLTGGVITYTFTFSDTVTGFIADDIVVTGGTKGTFSGSGAIYTLDITPTAGIEGNVSVSVASGVALGSSGSQNSAAIATPQAVDMKAPTATIAMSDTALKIGDTSTVTVTFSEVPVGFTEQDLSVANGMLSGGAFDVSGKIYTATFTPTANIESTTNLITLANTYTDVGGNTGLTATSVNYAVDVKAPILTITDDETANTANIAGGDILYTFSFSEAVSGFIASDIAVLNGTAKTFTKVSDTVYTLGVTPIAGATGDMSVTVAASAYSDVASNTNTVATQSVQVIDMQAPTAAITMSDSALKAGDTSTVTITFSEVVTGFSNADVTSPNGTLGAFTTADNKTWTATFTPSVNMDNTSNAITLADTYTDSNLNVGTIAVSNYTVDTKAPTATITMSDTALKAGETSTVTVTFSEAVSGFSNADVTVANGALLGAFTSNDNITWTATFTPSVTMESTTNSITLTNTYTDVAGNAGTTATSSNYAVDTTAPTATITMSDSALKIGDTSTVTVTFSEAVSGFSNTDVAAPNGTLGTFTTADNKTWIATFTPTTDMTSTTNAVSLVATYTDTAGNTGSIATSANYAIDTVAPTATIAMSDTALKIGDTSTVTITFSEVPVGFTEQDLSVANGMLSGGAFDVSGKIYTATFTPTANIESTTNLITLANSYNDVNLNTGGIASSVNYAVDTKAPMVTVTDNEPTITANMDGSNADGTVDADGGDILYTFTFTEAVTGFDVNQITLSANATAKTFTKVSDTVYTLGVTPMAGFEGSITVGVDPTNISDTVGNILDSTALATLSSTQVVDMLAPVPDLTLTDFDYEKNQIILTMNSSLEAVTMTTPDNFIVEINTKPVAVTAIGMLNDKVTLILAESFDATQSINVVYKDATGDMSAAIQDLAGNDATSFVYHRADTTPPEVTSIFFNNNALSIGQSSLVTLNFSEEISDLVVSFENGTLTGLAPNSGDASIWTATFTPTANIESLSNVLTAVSFHDLNKNVNTSTLPTAIYIIDTHAPSVMISDDMIAETINSLDGNITYTFTFSEGVRGFSFDDIVVKNGTIVIGSFTGSDGDSVYTVVVAPKTGFEGDVTVDVAASKAVDFLNNPNNVAIQSVQTVDTKPLLAPTFVLKTDSGFDDGDGITNIGTVNVTLNAAASNWEYSLDAGTTWRTGSGTSFNLSSGTTYAADTIQVRQYDVAGNPSSATSNSDTVVVDKTAPRVDTITPITLEESTGKITIAMDSQLNPNDIAKENFTITINGIVQTISGASVDGMNVILNVASFAVDASVRVSYADLSSTDTFPSLKDIAGNNAIAFTQVVADVDAPTATITLSDSALKAEETATVTITFTEAVKDFTLGDLSADSGVLSNLSSSDNITWTATFTPTVDVVSPINSITLAATYSDTTGVIGTTSTNTVKYSVDTQVPTVIITDNQSATTANISNGAITYTFTFSEEVTGFTADDVVVSGGTKGAFIGSGSSYTLVVTPNTGFEGNITVDVAANKSIDLASNNNAAATQSVQAVDIKAPTLVITDDESADTANIAGGSITYTFTFSEPMVGFTADDINVTNGTKGIFSGSGSSYTLVVTPTTGFSGDVKVEVLAANQVDSGGNTGTDTSVTQTVDMQAPTAPLLALANDTGSLLTDSITNNPTIDVTGLEPTATWEYSVDSGATWIAGTAQITGNSSFNLANNTTYGINTIQVRQTDAAGNVSTISKNSEAIQIDTKAPTITITDNEPNITANMDGSNADGTTDADGGDLLYTFTFDEAVKDFTVGDISITGGTAKTLTKVSDTVYTLGVTPTAGYEGALTISIDPTKVHDLAGNEVDASSIDSLSSTQHVDMLAPTYVDGSASANSATKTVSLTFSEALETVNMPAKGDFTVTVDGVVNAVFAIGMIGTSVNLILTNGFSAGSKIEIIYTDNSADLTNAIQDMAGNDATSFIIPEIIATSTDSTSPIAAITLSDTALNVGESAEVVIVFSEKVNNFNLTDLSADNGVLSNLSTTDNITWKATFTPNADITDTSNTINLSTTYTDMAGNAGSAEISDTYTIDTAAPTATIDMGSTMIKAGDTTTVTITFSEAVTGFSNADVSVANGIIDTFTSSDSGVTWTATFTPSTNIESTSNIITLANTYTDVHFNTGTSATSSNYSIDTKAPTVTITNDQVGTANIAGGDIVYTFTFREEVSGFDATDIGVANAIKGAFLQVSSTVYTLLVTPATGFEGDVSVSVAANVATDSAGNNNSAAFESIQVVDMVAPTVTVTLASSALTIGETTIVTITFSEAVANFDNSDVIAPNGTLSTFTSANGGSTWTALFTPTANISDASNVVQLLGTYTDVALNGGEISASANLTIDTRPTAVAAPTFALASDTSSGANNTDGITKINGVTVTLAAGITNWEYSLNGGTTWTTGSGTTFNLVENTSYAAGQIEVRQIDASNNVSSIATNTQTTIVDTIAPKLTITDNEPNITANMDGSNADGTTDADGGDILYTFTFDEAVKDFAVGDITITGGTAKTFTKVSDTVYTLGVTPTAGLEGSLTVIVAPTLVHDIAGTALDSSFLDTLSSTQAVDMKVPTYISNSIVADSDNDTITLSFSEILDAVSKPNIADFAIAINGVTINDALYTLGVVGTDLILTMKDTGKFNIGDTIGLAYNDNAGDVANAIQDLAGNDATSFGWVSTVASDQTAPTITNVTAYTNATAGTVVLTYNESLDYTNIPPMSAFSVNGVNNVSSITVSGKQMTLTLAIGLNAGDSVNIGYTDSLGNSALAIQDTSGNDAVSFSQTVSAIATTPPPVTDTSGPTLSSVVGDSGTDTITLTFREDLDTINHANLPDFYVTDGTFYYESITGYKVYNQIDIVGIEISGTQMILSMKPMDPGDWQVRYNDAAGDSANAIQDSVGNDATGFGWSGTVSDVAAPTASIVVADTTLKAGEISNVTITFSEVIKNFGLEDLTADNGILSNLTTTDNVIWTATFTPSSNIDAPSNKITLAASYTDAEVPENAGAATTSNNYQIDTEVPNAPTMKLNADTGISNTDQITSDKAFNVTLASDMASWEYSLNGGTTWTTGSGTTFNLVENTSYATGQIEVRQTDIHGNISTIATNTQITLVDTVVAIPTISSVATNDVIDASENANLIISGTGEAGATVTLEMGATDQTAIVDASGAWNITVLDPATSFSQGLELLSVTQTDIAGNTNVNVAGTRSIFIDTVVPTIDPLIDVVAIVSSDSIVLTFSEVLEPVDFTLASNFMLEIGGIVYNTSTIPSSTNVISGISTFGKTVTLILNTAIDQINAGDTVRVGYSGTSGGSGTAIQDLVGNDATSFGYITASLVDTDTPPVVTGMVFDDSLSVSTFSSVALTFNEALNASTANLPSVNDFKLEVNGVEIPNAIDTIVMNNTKMTLNLKSGTVLTVNDLVKITYTDASSTINAVQDLVGNDVLSFSYSSTVVSDTIAPTATVVLSDSALKVGEIATLTVTFSEIPVNFAADVDLTIANGILTNGSFDVSGKIYTATFTPTDNLEDTSNVVTLGTGWNDAAGNAPIGVTNSANYQIDTKEPTATVVLGDTTLVVGQTTTVTVTFSEVPTGFIEADDLTVQNGLLSAGSFDVSGKIYTATFTPTDNLEDASNVVTLGTGWTDAATNAPIATTDSANYEIDTKEPTFVSMVADDSADTIVMTFSEALDATNFPTDGQFAISLNGGANLATTQYAVGISGSTVTLTLDDLLIVSGQTAKVTYTDSTAGNDVLAIQDLALNDILNFTNTVTAVI